MSTAHALMLNNITPQLRDALNSYNFTKHHISENNVTHAMQKSSQRALQRLTQALLREEIIPATALNLLSDGNRSLRLSSTSKLIFEDLTEHRMSAWSSGGRVLIHHEGQPASPITLPSELLA